MNQTHPIRKCSDINVFSWFIVASFALYIIPFIVLIYLNEFDFDDPHTRQHFNFTIIYVISYCFGGLIVVLFHNAVKRRYQSSNITENTLQNNYHASKKLAVAHSSLAWRDKPLIRNHLLMINNIATLLAWFSVLIIFIYYSTGGDRKILSLGQNIDKWEYRIIGYDDTNRIMTAFLEIARRILMPFALLLKLSFLKFNYIRRSFSLCIFIAAAILGAIVNLDRGPIFLYLTLFFFFYYFTSPACLLTKSFYAAFFVLIACIIGSTVTFLQYNITDINLTQIFDELFPILIDRVILDPVRMGQTWAFDDFSLWNNPLYLRYSRLGALVGRQYVGTEFQFSNYVAPVGIFGDVWRNFGFGGAFYVGLWQGIIFKIISQWLKKGNFAITLPVYFLFFILIFYLFYGGLFSQGPFALIFSTFLLAWYNKKILWRQEILQMRA